MEMGKNGLVEVSKRVINDPRWTDAIVNFFIGG